MKHLVFALTVVFAFSAHSEDHPERPNMKLFTVELFPKARSVELKIAGKNALDAKLTSAGLFAQLHVGQRTIILTPVKKGDRYYIQTPQTDSTGRLEIKVNDDKKIETFEFELAPQR